MTFEIIIWRFYSASGLEFGADLKVFQVHSLGFYGLVEIS